MRVAVKNMSGVFIHSTTPRKARLLLKEKKAVIESSLKVYYIPSMDDNMFIVSVYEPLNFDKDSDYKKYYKMYKNMDDIVVG